MKVVLDCRWLGLGGAGRVTESLLRELKASPPPGDWTLWGSEEKLAPYPWPGATGAHGGNPLRWAGQRENLRVPAGDVVVYMHQIRPLRPGRSITVIHDTIPLRHGGSSASRLAKRVFLRAAARLSSEVLTDSEASRARIVEDLGVAPERITVLGLPQDPARAERVAALRSELGQVDRLLYVGRFAEHKNLDRLARVFPRTAFAAAGGRLELVGGWDGEVDALRAKAGAAVDLRGECSEEELDRLLATSRALVLPSLEEGFGLPAYEAVASGLPVAVSRTGALADLPGDRASVFDPADEDAMAAAIDEAVAREPSAAIDLGGSLAEPVVAAVRRVVPETTA